MGDWYALHTLPEVAPRPSQHHFAILKDKAGKSLQWKKGGGRDEITQETSGGLTGRWLLPLWSQRWILPDSNLVPPHHWSLKHSEVVPWIIWCNKYLIKARASGFKGIEPHQDIICNENHVRDSFRYGQLPVRQGAYSTNLVKLRAER